MVRGGIAIGLKPDDVRDMMPRDYWLCVDGWNSHHSGGEPGESAPTREEYLDLVRRVDG